MANVTKKRIKTTRLCAGDMKSKIAIQTRDLVESNFSSSQPVETFTTVRVQWVGIETAFRANGVGRFDGINIMEEASHLFWCMWDSSFPEVENRNHWILFDDRRFKILKADNLNERNTTIVIQCSERGEDTQEATKA